MRRLILIICLLLPFVSSLGRAEVIDRVVAIVNDDVITLSELNEMTRYLTHRDNVPLEVKKKILNDLINSRLALQQAKKMGIEVSDQEVEMAIKNVLKQSGVSSDELKRDLAKAGLSLKEYKKWIKEQIAKSKLLALEVQGKIIVTDDEIKQYYKAHKDKYQGSVQYHLRHILIQKPSLPSQQKQVEALKQKVWQLLKQGVPFTEVARKYSQAPTAADGGDLGWMKKADLDPKIEKAISRLKPGQFTNWIETEVGYQIIQLVAKSVTPGKSLKEVRNQIYKILYQQKAKQRYQQWMKQLRQKAYIQILL